MPVYTIHYSPARNRRGLKPWGVFEQVSPSFQRGISQHDTEAEAVRALDAMSQPTQKDHTQNG